MGQIDSSSPVRACIRLVCVVLLVSVVYNMLNHLSFDYKLHIVGIMKLYRDHVSV
jgi:hypothetical protein